MNKKTILLLFLALSLTACDFSTPEMEAQLVTAQSNADIAEREAGAQIRRDDDAHNLQMMIDAEEKSDVVNAARVTEYANAYAVAASRFLFVIALLFAVVGFSVAAVGAGIGTAVKAVNYGNLIFPNKQMQFPIRNYRAISTDGHRRLFAQHMGTGEVMRLDVTKPADAQMVAGLFETMLHNIDVEGAVGVAKNNGRARDVSYIDPAHILPAENVIRQFENALEMSSQVDND